MLGRVDWRLEHPNTATSDVSLPCSAGDRDTLALDSAGIVVTDFRTKLG